MVAPILGTLGVTGAYTLLVGGPVVRAYLMLVAAQVPHLMGWSMWQTESASGADSHAPVRILLGASFGSARVNVAVGHGERSFSGPPVYCVCNSKWSV